MLYIQDALNNYEYSMSIGIIELFSPLLHIHTDISPNMYLLPFGGTLDLLPKIFTAK